MKPRREILDVLFDALTNRPWKRVLGVIAAFYFLWVVLPWLLNVPPMDYHPSGWAPSE